jgi:hypothetical protein
LALYCRTLIGRYDRYGGVQFQSSLSLSIEVVLVRIWVWVSFALVVFRFILDTQGGCFCVDLDTCADKTNTNRFKNESQASNEATSSR